VARAVRIAATGLLLLAFLAAGLWCFSPLFFRLADRLSDVAVYRVPGAESAVALTLDDGPDPASTPELLRVLERHDARATFFFLGSRAARHPELARAVAREGHEIGHHMWRDEPSLRLDAVAFERRLLRTDSVLRELGDPRWLRPGGGLYSDAMVEAARGHGYRLALGDLYPFDTIVRWPRLTAGFLSAWVRPGSVIILHEGEGRGQRTAAILRRVLPVLEERGLEVVPLGELLARAPHRR
jgi:peptidoglycan/xylan/chitin deacetylase (PgdA/CDA1 family)